MTSDKTYQDIFGFIIDFKLAGNDWIDVNIGSAYTARPETMEKIIVIIKKVEPFRLGSDLFSKNKRPEYTEFRGTDLDDLLNIVEYCTTRNRNPITQEEYEDFKNKIEAFFYDTQSDNVV